MDTEKMTTILSLIKLNYSTPNVNDFEEEFIRESKIITICITTFSILLSLIGIIGSLLCIIIFWRPSFNFTSLSIYLRFLALNDCLASINGIVSVIMYDTLRNGKLKSRAIPLKYYCSFHEYGNNVFYLSGAWTIVALTIDRSISIISPTKSRLLFTKRRAKQIIFIIFLFWNLIYFPQFFLYKKVVFLQSKQSEYLTMTKCVPISKISSFYLNNLLPIFNTFFFSIIPSILLIFIHFLLFNSIIKARTKNLQLQNYYKNSLRLFKKSQQITLILFYISIIFMICSLPICILSILIKYYNTMDNTTYRIRRIRLATYFLTLLLQFNCSSNFFIYCLSGEKFRKELIQLFKF